VFRRRVWVDRLDEKSLDFFAPLRWKKSNDAPSIEAAPGCGYANDLLGSVCIGWRTLGRISGDRMGADGSRLLGECADYCRHREDVQWQFPLRHVHEDFRRTTEGREGTCRSKVRQES
jgi:hypothetical protein